MYELRELDVDDGIEIYKMLQDIKKNENGFQNKAKGLTFAEFKDYLKSNKRMSKGKDLPSDYVPQTIYWFLVDDYPVGMGKLRHYLNDLLKKRGGHASYAVRRSKRKKGYGKLILRELIKKAEKKGLTELLITCDNSNIASKKIIEANGGKLEKIVKKECFYKIKVSQ